MAYASNLTLFAAFEGGDGAKVTGAHKKRRRRKEFVPWPSWTRLLRTYPKTRLEVILDNLNTHPKKNEGGGSRAIHSRVDSAAQFCSTVTPTSRARLPGRIPGRISKPAVGALATSTLTGASRSAVSMSSSVVSGYAASTSVTTVVMARSIVGVVGKQHGVTVLEGKRHDARIAPRALTAEQLRPPRIALRGPCACPAREWIERSTSAASKDGRLSDLMIPGTSRSRH